MGKFNTYSLPQSGQRIDSWDKHSKYIVRVIAPINIQEAFYEYGINFYNAAHLIASYLLETDDVNISELDTYFFSLAFLYRHSLELLLKAIAFQTLKTDGDRSSFIQNTFHNLEEMLRKLEEISTIHHLNEELVWLRSYFSDLSAIDKASDSFRYPFHVKWEEDDWFESGAFTIKRIFEKQTHIDLVKFVYKFEAAFEVLNKWYVNSPEPVSEWKELAPVFLEEGGLYNGQSVVGYKYSRDDFYPYINAYLETACYLRKYMEEQCDLGNQSKAVQLFFPMCYLYRNCSELSLKAIWFEQTGEDFQKRCKIILDKKHSIEGMWNFVKPYAKECCNEDDDAEYIANLEDYCKQLHTLDTDASKFRYSVQKGMQPYFKSNKRFDFIQLGTFLEALNNALYGIDAALDDLNEYKSEMEAEYCSEMLSNCDYY